MWVVRFEGGKVGEAEVEVVAFVTERRGLPWVAQGIFFWRPLPHCLFSSSCLYLSPCPLAGLV